MTRVFVNGKEVTKEDLYTYEIKSESIKNIFAAKFHDGRRENEKIGN